MELVKCYWLLCVGLLINKTKHFHMILSVAGNTWALPLFIHAVHIQHWCDNSNHEFNNGVIEVVDTVHRNLYFQIEFSILVQKMVFYSAVFDNFMINFVTVKLRENISRTSKFGRLISETRQETMTTTLPMHINVVRISKYFRVLELVYPEWLCSHTSYLDQQQCVMYYSRP